MHSDNCDILVLGAGPAGLTAAAYAARHGARVLVLEKNETIAVKLLLAGGGKGNLTNRSVTVGDYVGEEPAFAAAALKRVSPLSVIRGLERAGIVLEEREFGQMFCATSARDVLKKLLADLPPSCAVVRGTTAESITRTPTGDFTVQTRSGERQATVSASRILAATGSPAWPQCGADTSGLHLARTLGHRLVPIRPVLAPLVLPPSSPFAELAGISTPVQISLAGGSAPSFTAPLLFTHKGISGPAVLQISCYWTKGQSLLVNFFPEGDMKNLLDNARGKASARSLLAKHLPERLCDALLPEETSRRRAAELSRSARLHMAALVHEHVLHPLRSEGLHRAEAAFGGVDTREVDPRTMESRLVPGLFFCGEMLDITGRLGGYNLHWAWASGTVAGEGAARA